MEFPFPRQQFVDAIHRTIGDPNSLSFAVWMSARSARDTSSCDRLKQKFEYECLMGPVDE
jgi:hypothetical protein